VSPAVYASLSPNEVSTLLFVMPHDGILPHIPMEFYHTFQLLFQCHRYSIFTR